MNTEQTMEIINALANKLGTTADHVYSVLLSQTFLHGIYHSVTAFFLLVLSILTGWTLITELKKEYPNDETVTLTSVVTLFAGIIGMCFVFGATTYLVNPEYVVIQKIVGMIK